MKISKSDALGLLRKWKEDATEVHGIMEVFTLNPLLKFRGTIVVLSEDGLAVQGGSSFKLFVSFSNAEFEYQNAREAPSQSRDWAESNFEWFLSLQSVTWRCCFLEVSEFPQVLIPKD
ncbi:MAG: hypothetical protein NVSMB56_11720 [Pyrinomonadaceae bacterium]